MPTTGLLVCFVFVLSGAGISTEWYVYGVVSGTFYQGSANRPLSVCTSEMH